jgi:hypothetical protein
MNLDKHKVSNGCLFNIPKVDKDEENDKMDRTEAHAVQKEA